MSKEEIVEKVIDGDNFYNGSQCLTSRDGWDKVVYFHISCDDPECCNDDYSLEEILDFLEGEEDQWRSR